MMFVTNQPRKAPATNKAKAPPAGSLAHQLHGLGVEFGNLADSATNDAERDVAMRFAVLAFRMALEHTDAPAALSFTVSGIVVPDGAA